MKKLYLMILLVSMLPFIACKKDTIPKDIPACIYSEIKAEYTVSSWPVSKVDEYTYHGNLVYVFDPGNEAADVASEVKDSNCNRICTPGGYRVPGPDCNGDIFFDVAVFVRTIWKK